MAFSEQSANYQLYLKTLGSLSGPEALEYERHFVQYLISQADATGTINSTMITNADASAKLSTKTKKIQY
jgi:hypothetical protein